MKPDQPARASAHWWALLLVGLFGVAISRGCRTESERRDDYFVREAIRRTLEADRPARPTAEEAVTEQLLQETLKRAAEEQAQAQAAATPPTPPATP